MASVELTRAEATGGELPLVCVCCGDAARRCYPVALHGRMLGPVQGPLCVAHRNHWRWRIAATYLVFAWAALMVVGFVLMMWAASTPPTEIGLAFLPWVVGLLGFPVVSVIYFVLFFTSVRVTWATKDSITLAGVAPAFVEALRLHRKYQVERRMKKPKAEPTPAVPLTDTARQALDLAQREARRCRHDHVGTGHLLCALSEPVAGVAGPILHGLSISQDRLRVEIERQGLSATVTDQTEDLPTTPTLNRVLADAAREAGRANQSQAGEGHLLLALLRAEEGTVTQLLAGIGANPEEVRHKVRALLEPAGEDVLEVR
jgi:hypothetical protein